MNHIEIRYTLIADGSSDRSLKRIIDWSLDDLFPEIVFNGEFADFRTMPEPPLTLAEKIKKAELYFPFQILFVHRDSEKNDLESIVKRKREILKSASEQQELTIICIIPVKMMETWLLIDADAIKKAAGNRNYSGILEIPKLNKLELETEPKQLLHRLLKEASGLKGRSLKKFNPNRQKHFVADYIQNYCALRNLNAFRAFENDLKRIMNEFISAGTNN